MVVFAGKPSCQRISFAESLAVLTHHNGACQSSKEQAEHRQALSRGLSLSLAPVPPPIAQFSVVDCYTRELISLAPAPASVSV